MFQDEEVLSFNVTFGKENNIEVLDKLAHFDKAPYGMKDGQTKETLSHLLFSFFNSRAIPSGRHDYQKIMKYTGCKDGFELAFKGHGLSLSNHYWFKKEDEELRYKDINFFVNQWDDSFARCVLSGHYEKLKDVDLNVPDILTPGWAIKGWLFENNKRQLYKLGIAQGRIEEPLTEVLASKLTRRMLNDRESLKYELKEINGRYASTCEAMIDIDEELVPLYSVLHPDVYETYRKTNSNHRINKEFFDMISHYPIPHLQEFFIKTACLRSLCFVSDLHFGNISVIRNIKTGQIRIAPLYDLAGAFGSTETGRKILSNINKGTYLIIYFLYGNLDSDWDYSWYNPDSLIGYEKEIRETLSKSDFYNEKLIDNIISVYQRQKSFLDEMKKKQMEKNNAM